MQVSALYCTLPSPQVSEQADHDDHSDTTQSTGHGLRHGWSSTDALTATDHCTTVSLHLDYAIPVLHLFNMHTGNADNTKSIAILQVTKPRLYARHLK